MVKGFSGGQRRLRDWRPWLRCSHRPGGWRPATAALRRSRTSASRSTPASASRCSGRTGAARPRCCALCSASSGRCGAASRSAGAPPPSRRPERSRLDFPVSALDVALMGALPRLPWWRRPEPRRPRGGPRCPGAGRGRRAGRRHLRRSLRRPAPAGADRPRPGAGRSAAAARRAVLGPRRACGPKGSRSLIARARRRGPRDRDRHPRPRPGAALGRRRSASTGDRSRSAPPDDVLDREVLEETYAGAIVEIPGTDQRGGPPRPPPLMIDFLTDPLSQEFIRRALLEVGLISLAERRARLLGDLLRRLVRRGVALARTVSGTGDRGAGRRPHPGRRGSRGSRSQRWRSRSSAESPGIGRDTAVAVVVTGFFGLGALLALSPDSPPGIQSLLFGDILAPSDSDLRISASSPSASSSAWSRSTGACSRWRSTAPPRGSLGHLPAGGRCGGAGAAGGGGPGGGPGPRHAAGGGRPRRPAATAGSSPAAIGAMMLAASALGICAGVAGLYLSDYVGIAAGAAIAGCIVLSYLGAISASPACVRLWSGWHPPGGGLMPRPQRHVSERWQPCRRLAFAAVAAGDR